MGSVGERWSAADIQLGHTWLLPSEGHLLCYFVVFNCKGTCFRLRRRELRDIVSMLVEKMGSGICPDLQDLGLE